MNKQQSVSKHRKAPVSRQFSRVVSVVAFTFAVALPFAVVTPASAAPVPAYTYYKTPTADSVPAGITKGPDGNVWFTEAQGDKIGKITTAGAITEYSIPTAAASPSNITVGPDGRLWFTESGVDKIGAVTTAGVFSEYPVAAGSAPFGIVAGPDGNLWFTEEDHSKIGDMSTAGVVLSETPIAGDSPYNIIVGSDNNLWFTEFDSSAIGTISTAGVLHEYTTAWNTAFLALASNGDVWFDSHFFEPNSASVSPAGVVTPLLGVADIGALAPGPDGDVWGHSLTDGGLEEFSAAGVSVKNYPDPSVHSANTVTIVEGGDHNLWFTTNDGFIGVLRFTPQRPVLPTTGVGPEFWIAGGIASVVVVLGAALLLIGRVRPRRPAHRG